MPTEDASDIMITAEGSRVLDLVQLGCDVINIITTCLNEDKCTCSQQ